MSARSQVHVFSQVVQGIGSVIDDKYSSEAVRNWGQAWGPVPTILRNPVGASHLCNPPHPQPLSHKGRGENALFFPPLPSWERGVRGVRVTIFAKTGCSQPGLWYEGYCWAKAQLQTGAKAQLQTGANLKDKIYGLKSNHAD